MICDFELMPIEACPLSPYTTRSRSDSHSDSHSESWMMMEDVGPEWEGVCGRPARREDMRRCVGGEAAG